MKVSIEKEAKFSVPEDFELPSFPGKEIKERVFDSTYYDSADARLAHADITLRKRVEKESKLWQLKIPRGAGERVEVERAGDRLPTPISGLLKGALRGTKLTASATLRTQRKGVLVSVDGRDVAEVTLDLVEVLEGPTKTSKFSEVEVEAIDATDKDLSEIARALEQAGAKRTGLTPKIARVLRDNGHAKASRKKGLPMLATNLFREIVGKDAAIRLDIDPEDIHDMRVAIRRLRCLLRLLPEPGEEARWTALAEQLAWLIEGLNPARDATVAMDDIRAQGLEEYAGELAKKIEDGFNEKISEAKTALAQTLSSTRYFRLLNKLEALPDDLASIDTKAIRLPARREFNRLKKLASSCGPDTTDEQLHQLRIRVKRSRYAAEFVGMTVPGFLQKTKAVQDLLGLHHDAAVLEEKLVELAAGTDEPRLAFVAGRLAERQQTRRKQIAMDVQPAIKSLVKSGSKAWDKVK